MQFEDQLTNHLNIKPAQQQALKRIGVGTIRDLLWHFPARYEESYPLKSVAELVEGEKVNITGKITTTTFEKTWKKKLNIAKTSVNDGTGIIRAVWFHQPYIARILKENSIVTLSGKVGRDKRGLYFPNPNYTFGRGIPGQKQTLQPIYPETKGLSSTWFTYAIKKTLSELSKDTCKDTIPSDIVARYNLPSLYTALVYIHTPHDAKATEAARKRFAFEEIFLIQLARTKERIERTQLPTFSLKNPHIDTFISTLPYTLTAAQRHAIDDIIKDMQKSSPMARLLEGDVGSGKTIVAAVASYAAISQGYQIAYMAPTEVLAQQHFKEFIERFSALGEQSNIGLITSSECRKFPSKIDRKQSTHISKSQLLRWVKEGVIPILIGTHSLIQGAVQFKKLAFVIVDEQHRFGVMQRAGITKKNVEHIPHFLSMTATPIPRTLALTIYGDLDLTVLDEMPPHRKKIITTVVPPKKRDEAYEKIRAEIIRGHQAYVVCPRINLPDLDSSSLMSLNAKAVKEEYKRLSKKIFPEFSVDMLHSKMKPKEKEKAMSAFRDGITHILVATSVIEVGVNVPNATVIMIEGAERFGLAQLHQLRGRVLRSPHQPYCFIFTESRTKKTLERLEALVQAKNGFELAEYDLMFRGAGELSGKKQWGISDVGMEALKNIKMVEAARREAQLLLAKDSGLASYPDLKKQIAYADSIHFE